MNREKLFSCIPRLEAETVALHEITDKDSDLLFEIYRNEDVFRFCGILPHKNPDTVRKMIGHFKRDFEKQSRIKWGIFQKIDDSLAGIIEVMDVKVTTESLTLGYYLNQRYWNKGYASEAVKALSAYLFNDIGANRIHAEVMIGNTYSEKVLLRNGFLKEGVIRQGVNWPGKGIIDIMIFGKLRSDVKGETAH